MCARTPGNTQHFRFVCKNKRVKCEPNETENKFGSPEGRTYVCRNIFSIFVFMDDVANQFFFTRQPTLLHPCFTRGRHSSSSMLVSIEALAATRPTIRVNETVVIVRRLRNMKDMVTFVKEVAGLMRKHH
jgi:hypothetical protein